MEIRLIQALFYALIPTLFLFISACSSQIPPDIRQALHDAPTIQMVQSKPDAFLSQPVRWGGIIINTENKQASSWLTVVAYPLSKNGQPRVDQNSIGRFIASFDTFLEPQVYSRERVVTITGKIIKTESLKVGEFPYSYPVVEVQQHFLWPVEQASDALYPPWWYDPYYWPYYPPHRY
jgi:outer membrane lipoprotein